MTWRLTKACNRARREREDDRPFDEKHRSINNRQSEAAVPIGRGTSERPRKPMSMWRSPPEKIGIHNPPFLSFGFFSDPLNVVHEPFQIARHEDLVFGSDIGTPVDIDLRIIDVPERTVCVEHHNDIIDIVRQSLRYLAPGRNMNRPSDPVQSDPVSCGQSLNAAYSRNHFVFECNGSSGNDPINDP